MIYRDFSKIPSGYYDVILSDPPWWYRNERAGGSMKSGSAAKYPVMKAVEMVKQIPVDRIAKKDACLIMWATVPMLDIAMGLLKSYKFNYKTMVIWKKESFVMGFWFRGNVEVCLVANRGKFPAFHCQKSNFIQSKPQGHSQKPEEFFELIEPIFDKKSYNKIELFARKPRNGWDSFGNQI